MSRRLRRAGALVVAVAAVLVTLAGSAAGEGVSRAAVVVDLGDEVRTARITFSGEITGIEALQLAGFDPVVRAYGGTGGAVCAICDHGCPSDSTCLTCGGADYWAYFRAPAGTNSYTYSPAGAGATRVRDGDVEAWKWGRGNPPRFVSFAEVWGEPATTTTAAPPRTAPEPPPATMAASPPASSGTETPAATEPPPGSGGWAPEPPGAAATPGGHAGGDGGTSGDRGGQRSTTTTVTRRAAEPGALSTTSSSVRAASPTTGPAGDSGDDSVAIAPELTGGEGDDGSPAGLAAFGVVAAGLGGWIAVAHRRRVQDRGTGARF